MRCCGLIGCHHESSVRRKCSHTAKQLPSWRAGRGRVNADIENVPRIGMVKAKIKRFDVKQDARFLVLVVVDLIIGVIVLVYVR